MGLDSLLRTIDDCRLLMLDTMVFSYHLSDHPQYAPLTQVILEAVESGAVPAVTSTMTLAELLTMAARTDDRRAMEEYELYLTHFPNLQLIPLGVEVARQAALIRAETSLRMPDAVQVATARIAGADMIVTNDRRWERTISQPPLILLDRFVG